MLFLSPSDRPGEKVRTHPAEQRPPVFDAGGLAELSRRDPFGHCSSPHRRATPAQRPTLTSSRPERPVWASLGRANGGAGLCRRPGTICNEVLINPGFFGLRLARFVTKGPSFGGVPIVFRHESRPDWHRMYPTAPGAGVKKRVNGQL